MFLAAAFGSFWGLWAPMNLSQCGLLPGSSGRRGFLQAHFQSLTMPFLAR